MGDVVACQVVWLAMKVVAASALAVDDVCAGRWCLVVLFYVGMFGCACQVYLRQCAQGALQRRLTCRESLRRGAGGEWHCWVECWQRLYQLECSPRTRSGSGAIPPTSPLPSRQRIYLPSVAS